MIDQLKQKLQQPLPGRAAQVKMASKNRYYHIPESKDATLASVMVLLFPKNKEWHFTLIQRVPHPLDVHSGQISFPGGRMDATDSSFEFTALRETEEEVGIPKEDVNVIGKLTELYIPVSNYLVHPFVGYLEKTPTFQAEPAEVASILEIPISEFIKEENKKLMDMKVRNNIILKDTPYFDLLGNVVWGATALMLSEFRELI